VIYLAVGGDLEALGTLRDELLHPPLAPPAGRRERSFVPHVTIDQRASPSRIPPSLDALGDYREGFTFERLTLLEQDDAHRWQPQMDVALGRPATVARGGLALELGAARRLDPAEARWVDEHWAAYGRSQYGPGYEADDPYVIAARRQGSIVGAAVGEVRGEVCELSRLIVDATVRREGIGSQLLRAVDDFGAEHGCRKVRLKTVLGGVAEAFYAGRGFSRETVLPAWREGRDFVVLSRPAGPTSGVPRRSGAVEREV
jgi:GNAT superfamily N-acetyltransferase